MPRDPNYVEPVWREGLREIAWVMSIGMAIAVLIGSIVVLVAGWSEPPEMPRQVGIPSQ